MVALRATYDRGEPRPAADIRAVRQQHDRGGPDMRVFKSLQGTVQRVVDVRPVRECRSTTERCLQGCTARSQRLQQVDLAVEGRDTDLLVWGAVFDEHTCRVERRR